MLIFTLFPLSPTKVEIESGTGSRIQILLTMDNSAGVFQIEKVLERKIRTSSLQNMVEVKVLEKGIQTEEPKGHG
jgi:metal-dependent HD superfamily phosphatase/phosphodiesterase